MDTRISCLGGYSQRRKPASVDEQGSVDRGEKSSARARPPASSYVRGMRRPRRVPVVHVREAVVDTQELMYVEAA